MLDEYYSRVGGIFDVTVISKSKFIFRILICSTQHGHSYNKKKPNTLKKIQSFLILA